jgi:hypothetical protein
MDTIDLNNASEKEIQKMLNLIEKKDNNLFSLTFEKIEKEIDDTLNTLDLTSSSKKIMKQKLKGYKQIEELDELKEGSYIKWYSKKDKILNRGSKLIKIIIKDSVKLLCKNIKGGYVELNQEEVIIYKKLSRVYMCLMSLVSA